MYYLRVFSTNHDFFFFFFPQSLDDSIASSVGGASLSAHPQLESLRSEVKSKDVLLSDLREELELLRGEKNQISDQLTSLWDRLNVSEVQLLHVLVVYTVMYCVCD